MLKFAEFFAGGGGAACGIEQAGGKSVYLTDFWAPAVQTLRKNLPGSSVEMADITKQDPSVLSKHGPVDVLFGGPPCQGFSLANKHRKVADPRNSLFKAYFSMIEALEAKAIVMENVPALTTGKNARIFAEMLDSLRSLGLYVDARILCAAGFGAPTTRQRVFVVATRKPGFEWPEYTHTGQVRHLGLRELVQAFPKAGKPFVTVGEALASIPEVHLNPDRPEVSAEKAAWYQHIKQGQCYHAVPFNLLDFGTRRSWNPLKADSLGWYYRLREDKPCPTILKTCWHAGASSAFAHPWRDCLLSVRELATLQGFPLHWEFMGTPAEAAGQVGNSISPPVAKALAQALAAHLG